MSNKYYLGVDVGASKVGAVILSGHKKVRVKYWSRPAAKNLTRWKKDMESLVSRSRDNAKGNISGIGVGITGVVNIKNGIVVKSPNIPFLNGFNAAKFF